MKITKSKRMDLRFTEFSKRCREIRVIMNQVIAPLSREAICITAESYQKSRDYCETHGLPESALFEACFQSPPFSLPDPLWLTYIHGHIRPVDIAWLQGNPYLQRFSGHPFPAVALDGILLSETASEPHSMQILNTGYQPDQGVTLDIGYYPGSFRFPVLSENGKVWMSIVPSELYTMEQSIHQAQGNVLVFGCGLAYYAYMVSQKPEVNAVTVVERNSKVIEAYKKHLAPVLGNPKKITIIQADAFEYLDTIEPGSSGYDFAFADIWQSAEDGVSLYLAFVKREKEHPEITFSYWIESMLLGSLCQTAGLALLSQYEGTAYYVSDPDIQRFIEQLLFIDEEMTRPEHLDYWIHPNTIKDIIRILPFK